MDVPFERERGKGYICDILPLIQNDPVLENQSFTLVKVKHKHYLKLTGFCQGVSLNPYRFKNPNNVWIWLGGWVTEKWVFRFKNTLVQKIQEKNSKTDFFIVDVQTFGLFRFLNPKELMDAPLVQQLNNYFFRSWLRQSKESFTLYCGNGQQWKIDIRYWSTWIIQNLMGGGLLIDLTANLGTSHLLSKGRGRLKFLKILNFFQTLLSGAKKFVDHLKELVFFYTPCYTPDNSYIPS